MYKEKHCCTIYLITKRFEEHVQRTLSENDTTH